MTPTNQNQSGPPFVPNVAGVGGRPTVGEDVPALAIFILLYLAGAISNMTIYQMNRRHHHKFKMSVAMFGFCMSRITTCVMRIVWATRPTNASIAIAAQIFTNVGILIVYVVVFVLAQRILRAALPKLGWNKLLRAVSKGLYALLFCAIVLVIAFTILSFFTLNLTLRSAALWIERGAITYLLIFNLIPAAVLITSLLLPASPNREHFGRGSMQSKQLILGVTTFLCNFIAGFRAGTTWEAARPASNPAWYDSKAAFYGINFTLEIVIIYLLLFTRFDKRFWVPDGSKKPGDYRQLDDGSAKYATEGED